LYGLFKFVTVSHTPNTSRPGLLDFAGRAKWDSWQDVGKKYSIQPDPDGAAEARYLEIAESLGWESGAIPSDGSHIRDIDDERENTKGIITGTGVFVSTPENNPNDLNTIHGLAIAGDAQKLETMLEADPSLDINQKDEFVRISLL
jgi:acyl-CoA-binding protein